MTEVTAITDLLNAANGGDERAQNAAYTLVYDELKRCARQQSRLAPGSSLTPTALVSELYVKLHQNAVGHIHSRKHFYALAARAMRQIAIDHARIRMSIKRGAGQEHAPIDTGDLGAITAEQTLELDDALNRLAERDVDLAQLVEWHFFAGLSFHDIADELRRHERTVRRDWELARAFLRKAMASDSP